MRVRCSISARSSFICPTRALSLAALRVASRARLECTAASREVAAAQSSPEISSSRGKVLGKGEEEEAEEEEEEKEEEEEEEEPPIR